MRRLLTQEGRAESGTTARLPRAPGRGTQRERWRGWPGTPSVGPGDGGCRELEPLVQAGFRGPAEAHPTQHLTGSLGHQAGLLGLGERQADCSTGPMGSRHPVSESRQRGHARRAVAQSAVPGARLHCDPATRDLCCRWEAEALPTGPPPPQPPLTGPPGLAGLLTAAHTWPLRSHPGQHFTRPPGAWHPLPRGLTINAARAGVRASRPVGRRPVARVQGPLYGPGFPDSGTPGLCKAPAPRLGASARAWVPLGPAGLGGPSPA